MNRQKLIEILYKEKGKIKAFWANHNRSYWLKMDFEVHGALDECYRKILLCKKLLKQ